MKQASWIILFLWTVSTRAQNGNALQACVILFLSLPTQIFFPDSQAYENSISSYAYIGTRLRPTCLARPNTTDDVATAVKILSKFSSVTFAIRSGGHNTNIGFAGTEDGITIDLSELNAVQLQDSSRTVSVGAGARSQSIYDALDPYQLSVQAGRNGAVGIGGFLTGGGVSLFSTQRGWACDSVINFEVVLSTGAIVNANATSHADLFIALKGGLNNFGVVTRFDLETFTQGPMWGGAILYTEASDKDLLEALADAKAPGSFDPYAMFDFGFVYRAAEGAFGSQVAMYHTQPDNVNSSALHKFANIQPQIYSSIRTGSPGSFTGEADGISAVVQSYFMHWATTTFSMAPGILDQIRDSFRETSIALSDEYALAGLTIAISFQSVPPAAPASNPNSLGYDPASKPEDNLINVGIAFQYADPAATEGLQQAIKDFTQKLDRIAEAAGAKDSHLYLNYAGDWQDVFSGYGNESLTRMRHVAQKYDRSGMFQRQVQGGFKLYK